MTSLQIGVDDPNGADVSKRGCLQIFIATLSFIPSRCRPRGPTTERNTPGSIVRSRDKYTQSQGRVCFFKLNLDRTPELLRPHFFTNLESGHVTTGRATWISTCGTR